MAHNKILPALIFFVVLFFSSCSSDDDPGTIVNIEVPETYSFQRNGESTVSFSGQTTRIAMAEALASQFKNPEQTAQKMLSMFNHEEGVENFENDDLNASDKNVRSKTAASRDFFSGNATTAAAIKADFESWINGQVTTVFPRWNEQAAEGVAGFLEEGGSGSTKRYVNEKGLEYDQAFVKSLIGALMTDQALNNYLSTSVLDEAMNVQNNNDEVLADGKNYTTMEHKWDEAYGYLYGASPDISDPNATIGKDDSFLNKYIGRVEGDADYAGIAKDIFDAFKLGRAAIVAKEYSVRDQQAAIIRQKISDIIAIRAVYYLQQAKAGLEATLVDKAVVFHDLSEGFGFIYSLQFTRKPDIAAPYFTKAEVDAFLNQLMADNGFWDVTPDTLQTMSEEIAGRTGISLELAGS